MSVLRFLFAWANAPYTVAAGIASLYALIQLTGILGLLAGDGGESDHDVEHDVDPHAEHDAETDARDGTPAALHVASASLLGPLGFGAIPLSVIWQTYAIVFAMTGFALNLHDARAGVALRSLFWTLPTSVVVGYAAVAAVARVLGPILSPRGQEATSRSELVGQTGVVISSRVDEEFGEIRIRDKTGHDLRLVCRLNPRAAPAREHQTVVVVDYDRELGRLLVEPLDDSDAPPDASRVEDARTGGSEK